MTRPLPATRKRFLEFIVAITVVHVVAITLYYTLHIPRTSVREQRIFAWTWMLVTVAVVFVGLQRLKRARRAP